MYMQTDCEQTSMLDSLICKRKQITNGKMITLIVHCNISHSLHTDFLLHIRPTIPAAGVLICWFTACLII